MYELVLKEKSTLLVWNYFKLQVCVDEKPINSEKLSVCCIMSSMQMWEEVSATVTGIWNGLPTDVLLQVETYGWRTIQCFVCK